MSIFAFHPKPAQLFINQPITLKLTALSGYSLVQNGRDSGLRRVSIQTHAVIVLEKKQNVFKMFSKCFQNVFKMFSKCFIFY